MVPERCGGNKSRAAQLLKVNGVLSSAVLICRALSFARTKRLESYFEQFNKEARYR